MKIHRRPQPRGFTLLELLVTIAIIGILAAMLLPSLVRGKRKTYDIQCVSNLRQVGIGLHLWLNDNDDWLPPGQAATSGLFRGQGPCYKLDNNSKPTLVYHLATYLGYPAPDKELRTVKIMLCPAFERAYRDPGRFIYIIDYVRTLPNANQLDFDPFGYPVDARPPHKISDIQAVRPLSDVWFLADADQQAVAPNPVWWKQLPEKPAHETMRNYIYFDNHVAPKKVGEKGKL